MRMSANRQSFLGTGWAFPPSFDRMNHRVRLVSDVEDIAESIRIILATIPGERVMQPTFGCPLNRLVFEKVDAVMIAEMNHMIRFALLEFEPRINFISADVLDREDLDGIIHIALHYSIVITNTRHNLVFPFYLLGEGTNL
jgi:hypothetical protein